MKTTLHFIIAAAASLGLGAVLAPAAHAQAPTIITTAPYTISTPGAYQLGANLVYAGDSTGAGAIITINASNVTLDFNGHYISGPSNAAGTSVNGIFANERGNLTILNGTVAYCYQGITLKGNGTGGSLNINQRIQNMLISYCYYQGIDLESAQNSEVSGCRISFTGNSTHQVNAHAVYNNGGSGNRITGNTITNVKCQAGGTAYGIYGGGQVYASGNNISGLSTGSGVGSIGIYGTVFAVGNTISNATVGIDAGGKYMSNLTSNCTTPFAGGTSIGFNN